jgi:hypothetical protein
MHRLGVNLRGDLYRNSNRPCLRRIACTRGVSLFAELGAAMRYGQWAIDADTRSPSRSDRQREAHIGAGFTVENQVTPVRHGWQLGFRLTAAPRDDLMVACRGTSCAAPQPAGSGETDLSFLVEWTYLIGR